MFVFDYWPQLAEGIGATITITLSSFVIGALLAVPITALRRVRIAPVRFIAHTFVEVIRGIPPLAWLFIVYFGLPQFDVRLDPLPSAIYTFSIIASAYISEIYRAGLRAVPLGQGEAATALGLGTLDTYSRVVAPQAVRTVVPLAITYMIGLLKDSAAASVIGVVEITGRAAGLKSVSPEPMEIFISAATLYLLMSVPVGVFGRWLGRRLTPALARS